MDALLDDSLAFLRATWSEEEGLFPYSTALVDGRYVNDYRRPLSLRYTVNTLLGLREAAAAGLATSTEVGEMTGRFLSERFGDIESPADLGLLLVLLRQELDRPEARTAAARVAEVARQGRSRDLSVQDVAWMLWGACASAEAGLAGAEETARLLYRRMTDDFVDRSTGLARHSTRRYRRRIVSFGSTVYFLRAMHEYGRAFDDAAAMRAFERGIEWMLGVQGPRGEWPWMIDAATGAVREIYPVFAVHQDSMAMLFLLPAHDAAMRGVAHAVRRSLAWGFGDNELGIDMYPTQPRFMAYRSIERQGRLPRASRYGRVLLRTLTRSAAKSANPSSLRVNPECRSYHLGWILYAWSRRRALLRELANDEPSLVRRTLSRTDV